MKKSNAISRHILKTITYRVLGTLTTMGVSLYCTGSFKIASMLGAGELLLKPILYFAHERIWYKFVKIKKN